MTVRQPPPSHADRARRDADAGREVLYVPDEEEALAVLTDRKRRGVSGGALTLMVGQTDEVAAATPAGAGQAWAEAQLATAQRALQASEERLRLLTDAVPHMIWQLTPEGDLLYANQRWREYFGREGLSAHEWSEILHPDDLAVASDQFAEVLAPGCTGTTHTVRLRNKEGSYRWYVTRMVPVRDEQGQLAYFVGTSTDIDDLKRAEREAQASESRLREQAEVIPHLVWEIDSSGHLRYANQRWFEYFGTYTLTPADYFQMLHPEDVPRLLAHQSVCASERGYEQSIEARLRRKDGSYRWFSNRWIVLLDEPGGRMRVVGTSTDIEDLKQAERRLRESQQQLQLAISASHVGLWSWDLRTKEVTLSEEWKRQLGYDSQAGEDKAAWKARVHPDDLAAVAEKVRAYLRQPWPELQMELRMRQSEGAYRWLLMHASLLNDERGAPERLLGCLIDITEHKRLEEELRQAQKMEAIGRLAGGVAHDFNNLLTVILGQSSLLERRRDLTDELRLSIRDIGRAAERAASLTGQLLAFGRKQVLNPRSLDLNVVVTDTIKMLERVLGDDVAVLFAPCAEELLVHADPNQLVQVLMNLALNARDAMPRGGPISIRTSLGPIDETHPSARAAGPETWARLEVEDCGSGIAPEVLPRIFEPFFTTKEVGKGTGLGLATVYGIVRQHGGEISVESGANGSTFRIFLPIAQGQLALSPGTLPPKSFEAGRERVLLVEDDAAVRAVLTRILEEHGYQVEVARDAPEALDAFERQAGQVDLVLSDVVMPHGMSGAELAEQLYALAPRVRVLLTSGYSTDVAQGVRAGVSFLQKPYSAEQLLSKVRAVLDKPSRQAGLAPAKGLGGPDGGAPA